jgi:hypothetical protein
MEPFRLKLKVGPHEFEAEGDQESVEKQLAVWRELIGSPLATTPTLASPPPDPPPLPGTAPLPPRSVSRAAFDKVFQHDGRVVSLTLLPQGDNVESDAGLLLLLGQKVYNGLDAVTGSQLIEGLEVSGCKVARADRLFDRIMDRDVTRYGQHRGTKYRMTHPGLSRASDLLRELVERVP